MHYKKKKKKKTLTPSYTRKNRKIERKMINRIYSSSSSSSCGVASMDLPDPLSPPVSIVYRSWDVFMAITSIGTELLYKGSSWPFCLCSFMWRDPQVYIAHEFVLTSPAASRMSSSSNSESFHDEWQMAVQLLICGVLP